MAHTFRLVRCAELAAALFCVVTQLTLWAFGAKTLSPPQHAQQGILVFSFVGMAGFAWLPPPVWQRWR